QADAADERSLVLDPQDAPRVGRLHALGHGARECCVAGLRPEPDRAERRSAMPGQRLEVQHLFAVAVEPSEELRLACPGEAADDHKKCPPRRLTQPTRKSRRTEYAARPGRTSSDPEFLPYPVKKRAFRSACECTNGGRHWRGSFGWTASKRRPLSVSPRPLVTVRPCHTTVRPLSQRARRSAPLTLIPARGTSSSLTKYESALWLLSPMPAGRIEVTGRTDWVTAG